MDHRAMLVSMALAIVATGCGERRPQPAAPARLDGAADVDQADRRESPRRDASPRPPLTRYSLRRTIAVGETVKAGPSGARQLTLVEVANDGRSAVFEAVYVIDRRRGRVFEGQTLEVFTPVFGKTGATLESVGLSSATILFQWLQRPDLPVPPDATVHP